MASASACVRVRVVRSSHAVAARAGSACVSEAVAAAGRPLPTETLRPHHRVRRSADYRCCYRRGRRLYGSLTTIHYQRNDQPEARLGITASRKVGNSVVRHRLKRRVREIFRRWPGRQDLSGWDLVVHLKPAAAAAEFRTLEQELGHLLSLLSRKARRA